MPNDDLEDGSDILQDVRDGVPKERKRPMAPIYIDQTQLPSDFALGTVDALLKVPMVDPESKKVVEKEFPFHGVILHIVMLSVEEQMEAIESAGPGASNAKVRIEHMKHAVRRFNNRPVRFDLEEQDTIYEAIGQKGQAILASGYAKASMPDLEAVQLMHSQFRWSTSP